MLTEDRERSMLSLSSHSVKAQFGCQSEPAGFFSVFLGDTQALSLLQEKEIVFLKVTTVNLFLEKFIKMSLSLIS